MWWWLGRSIIVATAAGIAQEDKDRGIYMAEIRLTSQLAAPHPPLTISITSNRLLTTYFKKGEKKSRVLSI